MINKPFVHRLKYYLIGVGLGILLVMAIFKDRNLTEWTPKNQVFKELNEKDLVIDDLNKCKFSCIEMNEELLIKEFISKGKVNFSASNTDDLDAKQFQCAEETVGVSE